jgi:hypothetical protein
MVHSLAVQKKTAGPLPYEWQQACWVDEKGLAQIGKASFSQVSTGTGTTGHGPWAMD